jgi:toxin CptA
MPAAPALRLSLRPSRLLAGALLLVHAMALAAVWLGLGGWARYLAGTGILASLGTSLLRVRQPDVRFLELYEDGRAPWGDPAGGWHEGRLGASHFASAGLVVLELKPAGRRRKWVVLMADSVSREDFRRLSVWLRWRARPEPE